MTATRNGQAAATDCGGLPSPTSVSLDDSVAVAVLIPEHEHGRHALAEAQHLGVRVDAASPKLLVRGVGIVGREGSRTCGAGRAVVAAARSRQRAERPALDIDKVDLLTLLDLLQAADRVGMARVFRLGRRQPGGR
jgi:hypothetical protein